jgi:Antirepressor regulating drug resistance, predicted signal transduction N-terminal membrane component
MDLVQVLFLSILNMSITAGYVILAVMLIRQLIRRAPKMFSYALWSVVGFRLLCPVSFSSLISMFNIKLVHNESIQNNVGRMEYVPSNIGFVQNPKITSGLASVSNVINQNLPAAKPIASVNPMQIILFVAASLWLIGIFALLIYCLLSYLKLKSRVEKAVLLQKDVYECDRIVSPFVMGIVKPKIYIPFRLEKTEMDYILCHERYHIHRKDYIVRPVAFLILIFHWFNPLVWIAFHFMCKDMEMSCDEKVISEIGSSKKEEYSDTLLSFSAGHRFHPISPLAFGERNTKERIKNVLRFRKPRIWMVFPVVIICIAVIVACMANPLNSDNSGNTQTNQSTDLSDQDNALENDTDKNNVNANDVNNENLDHGNQVNSDVKITNKAKMLYGYRNRYIGDAPKDGQLLKLLNVQKELGNYMIALDTKNKPYVLHINLQSRPEDEEAAFQKICDNSILLLALIDNADQIQWSYPYTRDGQPATKTIRINVEYLKETVGNIKSYGESAIKIKELLNGIENNSISVNSYYIDIAPLEKMDRKRFKTRVTYDLPKDFQESEFFNSFDYGGGLLFLKNGKEVKLPKYAFASSEWFAPGAALILQKEVTSLQSICLVRFKNGKLIHGFLAQNHGGPIAEPTILENLQEQAVLEEVEYDLFTAAGEGEAEAAGHPIPQDEQTSKTWQIFFARDNNHRAYAFILNEKYFTKQDAIKFAKSVRFSKDAFD